MNYLINYHQLYSAQLGLTNVFLIAVSYHSKVAAGRLGQASGKLPGPFGNKMAGP